MSNAVFRRRSGYLTGSNDDDTEREERLGEGSVRSKPPSMLPGTLLISRHLPPSPTPPVRMDASQMRSKPPSTRPGRHEDDALTISSDGTHASSAALTNLELLKLGRVLVELGVPALTAVHAEVLYCDRANTIVDAETHGLGTPKYRYRSTHNAMDCQLLLKMVALIKEGLSDRVTHTLTLTLHPKPRPGRADQGWSPR